MSNTHNGPHIAPKATDLVDAVWVKSTRSGPTGGNCVEVAFLPDGDVALRNSRHPTGSALIFARAEWDAFIGGAQDGEFASPARAPA
jgi:Domain of unknown function (DUF397)